MRRAGCQHGQATVELAMVIPVIVLLLLGIVQVALVARDHVIVVHAARAGARAAAVEPVQAVAERAAFDSAALDPTRTRVFLQLRGDSVTVTVVLMAETGVPLIGSLVGDVQVQASATFRVER